jgi:hypothetical protein
VLREGLPPQASGEPEGVSRPRRLANPKGVGVPKARSSPGGIFHPATPDASTVKARRLGCFPRQTLGEPSEVLMPAASRKASTEETSRSRHNGQSSPLGLLPPADFGGTPTPDPSGEPEGTLFV